MSETVTTTFEIYGDDPASQVYGSGLYGAGGYGGSGWVDLSSLVMEAEPVSLKYGMTSLTPAKRVAGPGALSLTLDNEDHDFTPGHADRNPVFLQGNSVRFGISWADSVTSDTLYKYWRGRLTDINPASGRFGERMTRIQCTDWIADAGRMRPTGLTVQTSQRGDQLMTTALAAAPRQPPATDFDVGISTFPYAFDNVRDDITDLMAIIDDITRSELGWCAQIMGSSSDDATAKAAAGTLKWWSRYGRINETASLVTLTDDGDNDIAHGGVLAGLDERDVFNFITGTSFPRSAGATDEIMWQLDEALSIAAGATAIIKADFRDPNNTDARVAATAVWTPDSDNWTFSNGFGTLTIVEEIGGNQARYEITNTGSIGNLTQAVVRGTPLRALNPVISERQDDDSITQLGELPLGIRFQLQDDPNEVDSFLDLILAGTAPISHVRAQSLRIHPNQSNTLMRAFMEGDIGNKLLIDEDAMAWSDQPVFIDAVSIVIRTGIVSCDWTISDAGLHAAGYFILDVSQMDVDQLAP